MTIIQTLKRIYRTTKIGRYILHPFLITFNFFLRFLSDTYYAKIKFQIRLGYKLNLINPQTLNEKIQWFKLNDRTPLHTLCADKYAVRGYIKEKIGEEYLVPLIFKTKNPNDLKPENLPDFPFIIKTSHSSSRYHIIKDKYFVNWKSVRKDFTKWLKENIYYTRREWQYKNIIPRIIVEKLLLDSNNQIPFDYKFHCFNGEVKMVQVDLYRGSNNHCRNWYYPNWETCPFKWSAVINGHITDPIPHYIKPPEKLNKLISFSTSLSKDFRYARIDWYNIDDKIYFSEITFYHDGGFRPILPPKWDMLLGRDLYLNVQK